MNRLNRYLMKNTLISISGLIVVAIAVLLLERLLRIFKIVTNSPQPALDAGTMIANLLPHYLGIALPMALMLGIIITIDRFSRSSELTAAYGAGISLFHLTKPFILIAIILAGLTVFIEGYMQPIARYNYRQVVHSVKQHSFTAILREGTFTKVGDRMFYAGAERPGRAIGPIFIYERLQDKSGDISLRVTTAEEGQLIIRKETGEPVLQLAEGQIYRILDKTRLRGDLSFESSSIAGTADVTTFRIRGDDERELTSLELFKNRKGRVFDTVTPEVNNAALHMRIARAAFLLIMPFIAVPFGLNYGRNPSSTGIFVGILLLVSVQKSLELAQNIGAKNILPPWLCVWAIILIVAAFAFFIFTKSAFKMGHPPLTSINMAIENIKRKIAARFMRMRRAWVELR